MITSITMKQVASYKNPTILETDKKVNLIYGLNGTGKSTISDYLYNQSDTRFTNCSILGLTNEEVLVYNQTFIKDYFYESENLKGIFTLSKENKEVEIRIKSFEKDISELEIEKNIKQKEIDKFIEDLNQKKQNTENIIWEIKTNFTGGDRILDYCFERLKGSRDVLFSHLLSIEKPVEAPKQTIEGIKKEAGLLQESSTQKQNELPIIELKTKKIESNQIFSKVIIGNESSPISELIKTLNNSDWVKKGLDYIPKNISDDGERCPFCQEQTISNKLVENISNYYDKVYENDISELNTILSEYDSFINAIPKKEYYEENPFIIENKPGFENLYNSFTSCLKNNKEKILEKIQSASQIIYLEDSNIIIEKFNAFIETINSKIKEYNIKIDNKDASLNEIKNQFWEMMKYNYDQTISIYLQDKITIETKIQNIKSDVESIDKTINEKKESIVEHQKKTVNIEQAISSINEGLNDLGIDCFRIEKDIDIFYKLVRAEVCDNTFLSLSEGEKMIISFLYFIELCKGKKGVSETKKDRIIIIDDPISSLSHIYVFNIGQLIKSNFTNPISDYKQVFIFTHSLYFFYELTFMKPEDRDLHQKLFRIIKNQNGSEILTMKYTEIQNDYQSYWQVIKDPDQPPALIANCMRNIIEYFFGFIEKSEFSSVIQKPELKKDKYQAFCRYMNRESHSFGQNIFDMKEFDYNNFKEAFKLVFQESGYKNHYTKMIK